MSDPIELIVVGHHLDLRVRGSDSGDRRLVDVGDDDLGPVVEEMLNQVLTDLADPCDSHPATTKCRVAPADLRSGPHGLEYAVRREDARVARTSVFDGAPGDVVALAGDDVHVLAEGADVTRGEVATMQRLNEPSVGP